MRAEDVFDCDVDGVEVEEAVFHSIAMPPTIAEKLRVSKQTLSVVGFCILGLNIVTFVTLWIGLSYKPSEPMPEFDGCHLLSRLALWMTGITWFFGLAYYVVLRTSRKLRESK